ncbi:transcription factor S-II, central domain-containing protein [Mycotypha africana]|uniref:transcription factor S-II, central domain-containing protein n=1 Tax=Mycotypha africana TaxID=64632 RepID=UPI00230158F9|nr:transcription factor S-II, central domain-containing protein [Mycotypha africana]KAI8973380.1 transcription factor S-II, central domain-containing protein [Mycotypha africana]
MFHCECVGFDPEDTDVEDDAEWICKTCIEDNKKEQESLSTDSQQNSITNVNMTATANASPTISAPIPTLVNPTTTSISTTRQSRSGRSQSKCLYAGCQNRTRADSFCSDVCARKHNEDLNSTTRNMRRHSSAANRIHAMTGVTPSTAVSSGQTTNSSTTKGTEAIIKSTGMDIDTDNANVVDDNEDDVAIDQDDEKDEDVKMEDIIEEEDDGDDSLNEEDEEDEEDEFEFKAKPVSTSPKTTHSKNRRKSSATKTKASLEGGKAPSAKSPSEKEKVASSSATQTPSQSASPEENPIRRNVIKSMTNVLKPIFDAALEKNPGMLVTPPPTATTSTAAENADGESKSSELSQNRAEQLARSIESAMLEQLGESKGGHKVPGDQYKSKFRSLLHNLKDKANQVFQLRVITGDLTPVELTGMSSEDMANPELKSKDEDMRKKSLKNSVMKIENMPIIKKTHKGDIIMLPNMDHQETEESMYSKEVQDELLRISNASRATTTTTTTGATDDDGGRSGSGTPISSRSRSASYSQTPTPSDEKRFSFGAAGAKVDPLNNILSRLGAANSSGSDSDGPSSTSGNATNKRSNSLLTPSTEEDMEAKKRKLNEDLEKMLGEDDETPFMVEDVVPEDTTESEEIKNVSEPVQQQLSSTIWKGRVNMPQVAEFEASARQIGGRILNEEEWQEVLSPNMWIEGRIRTESVTDYVTQTQYSNSREIVLIEVEAEGGDDNQEAQSLLHYLESRKRYAVVGHNKTRIKDFYLIPLYKTQEIPDCLYVVRVEDRKKRPVDVFLGVLVLTKQKLQPHHGPSDGTITAEPTAMDASRSLPIAVSEASTSLPTVETTATVPPILPPELQFLQHLPQLAQLASQQQQSHQSQPYQASYSSYQAAVAPVSQQAYQPSYGYQAAPIAGSSSINTGSGYQQNYNHSHRPQQRNQRQRSNNNNRRHHYNNNVNSNGNSYHPSYRK